MRYAEFNMHNDTVVVDSGPDPTTVAKIAAMFTLGISSFLLGVLPIKLASLLKWDLPTCNTSGSQNSLAVHLLLSFGGGVLLYTCLMHLQPEVREGMDHVIKMGLIPESVVDSGINWSEFIFCMGFFLVYFIEEIVHTCLDKSKHEDDMQALHRTISIRKKCRAAGNLIPRIHLSKPNQSPPSTITASTQVLIRDGHYKSNTIDPMENMVPPISQFAPSIVSDADSGRIEPVRKRSVVKSFRGFIAVVALSFHAIFEGLAVGLEKNAANVWYLCAAIATHKLVIAFCVGVELVSTRTKTLLIIIYMATFAIVSPLGIGIGLGLTFDKTNTPEMALVSIILQGLASGTLLYVVFFEVLQREKAGRHGMVQLLSILAGFAVMILLSLFIGHHHTHHEHDDHGHDHHSHSAEILHHEHT